MSKKTVRAVISRLVKAARLYQRLFHQDSKGERNFALRGMAVASLSAARIVKEATH